MQILVSEISKYIIIIIIAIYAYLGFIGFINNDKYNSGEIYFFQPVLTLMFHFAGFLCIFLKMPEMKVILLYLAQILLLISSTFLYRIFYKNLFKSLFSHMQFLITIGFVFLTRLKFVWGVKQTVFVAAALVACLILPFLIKKMSMLRSMGYLYAIAGIGSLAYVFLRAKVQYGAKNWINIFGMSIQPSEFVKILLIFMIASLFYVSKSIKQIIITTSLTAIMVLLLVLSKDLGGAMLFFTTFTVMTYFATGSLKLLGLFTGGGVISAVAGYYIFSHVRVRVQAFVDPWKYIDDKGYQVTQSLFGMGSGGWFGFGLGNGLPSNTPVVESDFIFSGLCEELGLLFGFCLILIYLCTIIAFILLAWRTKNQFHQLVSIGCATMYSFQIFLSIGGTVKFIPSTGVTLPLVSQGGSSVISTIIIFGVIQGLYIAGTKKEDNVADIKIKRVKKPVGLVYIILILFVSMSGYLIYFQFITAPKIMNNSYNKRTDIYASYVSRGKVLSSDGDVLAYTREEGKNSVRVYPYGDMYSHIVGRNSSGKTGIEGIMNYELLSSNDNVFTRVFERINQDKNKGDSVVTTVDSKLQKSLNNALKGYHGAGVILEPSTGRVLAMVSKPDYDPNTVIADWETLSNLPQKDAKLVNRATNGLYPPGSTFKVLTALEYINEHKDYDKFSFDCKGIFSSGKESIVCFDRIKHGKEDLKTAFAKSCNGAFASIGFNLNKDKFAKLTEKFLYNKELPFELTTSKSSFVLNSSSNTEEILQTSIGQGKTQITPFHNALIASAIANDGMLMKPYTVEKIVTDDGKKLVNDYKPEKFKRLCSKKKAEIIKGFMKAVVTEGTAQKLSHLGYNIYGKTGTAEYQKEDGTKGDHSWFMGFGERKGKKIAISIVVEGESRGNYSGTDVASKVFANWK
ncbi:MAG: FtsW/RodA/SpoVE family cell cycle protein [Catonella sp.]|uniref:FtsW/RodA/SpoVE family cell cycle protein n=1 Tax=Catonella sp. TaxID=2382125 RepID=UPI003F9EBE34